MDLVAALRTRVNAAPIAPVRSCAASRFHASAVSGPITRETESPELCARRFAILSSRPPGFICATTFGSSEPSGSVIGSATAGQTNETDSNLSIGCPERMSTATSHVTNDCVAVPVFTSCTSTGYTPGRLTPIAGRTSEPVSPNDTETSPRASR